MICHKLKLRPEIAEEIYSFNKEVNKVFFENEPIPDKIAYWCVEETNTESIVTQCRPERMAGKNIFPLQNIDWKWFCDNVKGFEDFFKKYKLQNFIGSVLNPNFETHRHVNGNDTSISLWNLAVFNDHGTFNLVEPIDDSIIKYKNYGLADDGNWISFDEISDECELNILEQHITEPGDMYFFNGWTFHQYFTDHRPMTTVFWGLGVITNEQALEFIKHIESL